MIWYSQFLHTCLPQPRTQAPAWVQNYCLPLKSSLFTTVSPWAAPLPTLPALRPAPLQHWTDCLTPGGLGTKVILMLERLGVELLWTLGGFDHHNCHEVIITDHFIQKADITLLSPVIMQSLSNFDALPKKKQHKTTTKWKGFIVHYCIYILYIHLHMIIIM